MLVRQNLPSNAVENGVRLGSTLTVKSPVSLYLPASTSAVLPEVHRPRFGFRLLALIRKTNRTQDLVTVPRTSKQQPIRTCSSTPSALQTPRSLGGGRLRRILSAQGTFQNSAMYQPELSRGRVVDANPVLAPLLTPGVNKG